MKTESTVKYVLRIALTLLAITAVVAVILAAVNSVTAPRIAAQNEQKTQNAIEAVLPGGGQEVKEFTDDTGLVTAAYKGDNGCAVQVTPNGFNGTVTMMVGVDNDGKVTGISIISHTETAGLGATAADTDAGRAFRDQFIGMSGTVSVTKDGGEVDALTGATITSRAVCTGVSAALACAANLG